MCFPQIAGHSANIYAVSQPSPDSDGFAGMKIRSPTSNSQQAGVDGKDHKYTYIRFLIMMVFASEDVEQLSGKIDSIKLNEHVPSLSDCVNLALDIQHQAYGQVICSTCYAF